MHWIRNMNMKTDGCPNRQLPQQMWDFLISELTDVNGEMWNQKVEMGKLNDYAINMLLAKNVFEPQCMVQ